MKRLEFKTNINCGSCVAKVTPHLNNATSVDHWSVDTTNKEKVLTVEGEALNEKQVVEAVQEAGFKLEKR